LKGSERRSEAALPEVHEDAVPYRFGYVELSEYDGVIHRELSIRIQEYLHHHVPVLESHHDLRPHCDSRLRCFKTLATQREPLEVKKEGEFDCPMRKKNGTEPEPVNIGPVPVPGVDPSTRPDR